MPILSVKGRQYPWPDPTTITFREAQIIKKRLGFSIMGMFQNLASGQFDEEALLGMFVLAKIRTDGDFDLDQVLGLGIGDIQIEDDNEDNEAGQDDPAAAPLAEPAAEAAEAEPERKPKSAPKKNVSSNA